MFYFDDFYGKKILKSTLLSEYDCFFTTREFVLTAANRNDLELESEKNREFLKSKLHCEKIISSKQVHSSNVKIVDNTSFTYEDTDALISNIPNSLILMNFADCVPIILYSKNENTGAIVHAGWRGTASEILKKTIIKMRDELNICSKDITALIGPSIGQCCFETDEDVFKQLIKNYKNEKIYHKRNNKFFINLKELNKIQLQEQGVENIDICSYCTCCMSDIFFSYRKEKGVTARHSAIVKIKGDNICQ